MFQNNLQQQLQSVIQHQQAGRFAEAEAVCRQVLISHPDQPDALHFLAMLCKRAGDTKAAQENFEKALKLGGKNPAISSNYANFLSGSGQHEVALAHYARAVKLEPRFAEALYNWGLALTTLERYDEAEKKLREALMLNPNDSRYHNALGLVFRRQEQNDKAIAEYEQAVRLDPNNTRAIHNLGGALRAEKRLEEAKACCMEVIRRNPQQLESWQNYAAILHEEGDNPKAIQAYKKLLEIDPTHMESHRILNNIIWESEAQGEFLNSYERAMQQRPDVVEIPVVYAEYLNLAGYPDKSLEMLERAIKRFPESPELNYAFGKTYNQLKDYNTARGYYEKSVAGKTDDEEYHFEFARMLINMGDLDYALRQLEAAERINPDEQTIWALRAACWRLMEDEREHWLQNYDLFVRGIELKVPEGYGSIEEFNEHLLETLVSLHKMQRQPLDQTLRGGTQTFGHLYGNKHEVISKLRAAVYDAARRYIADLPEDKTHPLTRRLTHDIKFSGSWSCRLKSQGFHTNHMHPKGWISGPYYVSLPDEIKKSTDDGDRPGWVKFGEANLIIDGKYNTPRKMIKPEEGMQVFFPSYTWHGTNPFTSDQYRVTAPCDIAPL
ncbi:tetratricopeptide repeat protein [Emcibacter sp.]|uniref:tetratricopeptide repeat protein n=1 Tax=Emcibacter sp. TaxID=1979954 RepID=UPI003A92BA9C